MTKLEHIQKSVSVLNFPSKLRLHMPDRGSHRVSVQAYLLAENVHSAKESSRCDMVYMYFIHVFINI